MRWLSRFGETIGWSYLPGGLRKLIAGVVGLTILLIGVGMIVLPGPALIMIPLGLGILATEFAWARRTIRRARVVLAKARGTGSARVQITADTPP